ncbi:M15 family metallopeptidase [Lysinibacillus sp. NPDC086135]|uniref:M15 family metallopeptidase n=1 Tax=Lysinibacillus sp. NPDC086135 TaxID=3364130 RepID=UPI0037F2A038
MIYDKRNKENLDKLAVNTRALAYKWYQYCVSNKIEVLVYETIRSVEQQKANVAKGASQTMKSYHIVGQALDWVLVDSKGNALWNAYNTTNANKVINYAKSIGFESGRDWGWDAPHLQYEYKGYGTDTFEKVTTQPKKYNLGYDAPKNSKAYRLHTTAFKNKAESEKAKVDYVKNGYLAYAEVFGNDKDGYRLQSGKYISQKDAEKAAMRLINVGLQDYVSIIGRPN